MIRYDDDLSDVTPDRLDGFFVGWPSPPTPERHLELLRGSDHVILAREEDGLEPFYERLGFRRVGSAMRRF